MFSDTQWDHEVDVVCLGAEGGVLAAGLVATNEDLDVYLGITESAGGGDLAASLTTAAGTDRRPSTSPASTTPSAESGAHRASGRYAPSKARCLRAHTAVPPSSRSSARYSSSGHTDARRRRTVWSTTG